MSRTGWTLLAAIALAMLATRCASMTPEPFTCEGVQVISLELTVAQAQTYCRYAVRERQKVEEYWGPTWTAPIRIHVSSEYRISRALVPAYQGNRGFLEMPARRVGDGTGALLHEIVHIYAPHGNRFLAEGLAVHLHAKLAGNPAFPNFGEDLKRLAARDLPGVDIMSALNAVRTPRPLGTVLDEKTSYVLAGSLVGFLIERYGLARFRSLYETESYETAYGKPFASLEREWRSSLRE
jgi:hypothetical protein